jgi:hypothetical protein
MISNLITIALLVTSLGVFADTLSKTEIQKINNELVYKFTRTLSDSEKQNILKEVSRINKIRLNKKSTNRVIKLFKDTRANTEAPLVLLVQGYPNNPGKEKLLNWYQPFHYLRSKKITTYFHSIDSNNTLSDNAFELQQSILKLKEKYPSKTIEIIGYSAGGSIALYYLDKMRTYSTKVTLATIASPLFGYGAPNLLLWLSTNIGFKLAVGMRFDIADNMQSCSHYITTDCNKDIHACEDGGKSPQLGFNIVEKNVLRNSNEKDMPCGNENSYIYEEESHVSILDKVIREKF